MRHASVTPWTSAHRQHIRHKQNNAHAFLLLRPSPLYSFLPQLFTAHAHTLLPPSLMHCSLPHRSLACPLPYLCTASSLIHLPLQVAAEQDAAQSEAAQKSRSPSLTAGLYHYGIHPLWCVITPLGVHSSRFGSNELTPSSLLVSKTSQNKKTHISSFFGVRNKKTHRAPEPQHHPFLRSNRRMY